MENERKRRQTPAKISVRVCAGQEPNNGRGKWGQRARMRKRGRENEIA